MSTVRLSDVVEPRVFSDYQTANSVEKTVFSESGIMVRSPMLDAKANSGGKSIDVPFWKDLANTEPNVGSDDPAVSATPEKIATGDQIARIAYLNKAYSATDLASEIAGSNAMRRIKDRTDKNWMLSLQARVISTLRGILASNVANNSGDMVYDVATDAVGLPGAAQLFGRSGMVRAALTLGDSFENTGALGVHSVVYGRMLENDEIDFVADSQGQMIIPTYLNHRVIRDDGLPVEIGTNRNTYTSVLFGAGVLGFGEGTPEVPVEVTRQALQGNGQGVEILSVRKTWLLHAFGMAFTSAVVAGMSPTHAELRNAANWIRVFDQRKQIPLAFYRTNG